MYKERKTRVVLADATKYQLGILWGIGSYLESENALVFRHKEEYYLQQISNLFESTIYSQIIRSENQYVLKTHIVDYFRRV